MLPAVTLWPPNTLTPRYCALLSRPLRVAPWPFLCAIGLVLLATEPRSAADAGDPQLGERLTMAVLAAVALAAPNLEHDQLALPALSHDLGAHLRARDERLADLQGLA